MPPRLVLEPTTLQLGANRSGTERFAVAATFSLLTARARFRSPKSRAIEENEKICEEQSTVALIRRHRPTHTHQSGASTGTADQRSAARKVPPGVRWRLPVDAKEPPPQASCGIANGSERQPRYPR
jgi:hypothetical protein